MEENLVVKSKGSRVLMVMYRSCCERRLAVVALWVSLGRLGTVEVHLVKGQSNRNWAIIVGKEEW